jgi:hypothetical protein
MGTSSVSGQGTEISPGPVTVPVTVMREDRFMTRTRSPTAARSRARPSVSFDKRGRTEIAGRHRTTLVERDPRFETDRGGGIGQGTGERLVDDIEIARPDDGAGRDRTRRDDRVGVGRICGKRREQSGEEMRASCHHRICVVAPSIWSAAEITFEFNS